MNHSRRYILWMFVAIIVSLGIGLWLGAYLYSRSPRMREVNAGKNKINTILNIIDTQYVDTVNMNDLVNKTAASLISELDPHSVLIPAENVQAVNDDLEGSFSGIGVSFNVINDTILIITVMPGGPAEKAGLQPFDRIISINDSTYAGQKYSQAEIMRNLRGPRDSKVKLGIQRDHSSELAFFEVTRGEVPNHSIEVSYKIGRKIGYIKIRSFARTTYNEFITAIAKLKEEGCTDFIIDLRDNAGGMLDAAVRMLNEFIPRGRPIVYMEGKAYRRQDFHADGSGSCQEVPIIVLTDELSGSASEIFAGAIQDNDRGLIIGRRSFGKGLVQAPIPLSDGSELRLTIARYYTPSGRCIQKMYQLGKSDEYEQDLYQRFIHGEFDSADSIKMDQSSVYKTLGGRTVYGGGGIMPDIFIPRDTSHITSYYNSVMNKGLLYQFTIEYAARNYKSLSAFKTYQDLYAYLQQLPVLSEFTDYAEHKGVKKRPMLINISRNLIEKSIQSYIVRHFFDYAGFYPVFQKDDVTLRRAVQVLEEGRWRPEIPAEEKGKP
ncbi:S41 family peptidase [Tannerella forsythia]|uniref:S41 family peptidase n=1 Tax=Tannerella forsythia TaxID=28112 RepID=UPI0028E26766|nr:S41 family peptidase [Tannerella forsythia]